MLYSRSSIRIHLVKKQEAKERQEAKPKNRPQNDAQATGLFNPQQSKDGAAQKSEYPEKDLSNKI